MIPLPEGYTVKHDDIVGYTYYDNKGNIVIQHPYDNDTARKVVIAYWRNKL